jgi:hypothetical protein
MGSILNFVFGNDYINGSGLVNQYGNNIFNHSVILNHIESNNISRTYNFEIRENFKNLFLLECNGSLNDLFEKDINDKTIFDYLPNSFINDIKNKKVKILLSSIAESSSDNNNLFEKIENILKKYQLDNECIILIDSNVILRTDKFKLFKSYHFLIQSSKIKKGELTELGYYSEFINEDDVYKSNIRQKHFISFNRNTQKTHRHFLCLFLEKENLINNFILSALRKISEINDSKLNYLNDYIEKFNIKVPLEVDTHNLDNKMSFSTLNTYKNEHYLNSYFHVVTETCFDNGEIFFTEKITKPIIGLQPFMVLSSPRYLLEFKKLGFKTYDSIFDESYDNIEDNSDRLINILSQIKQICKLKLTEVDELYKSVLDICIYNRNHLFSMKNINEIDNILKEIENEW